MPKKDASCRCGAPIWSTSRSCLACHNARQRDASASGAWTNGEKQRYWKFGLSPSAVDKMLAAQGGRCYVCRCDEPGGRNWCIDHCHRSGAIRFVLCTNCNTALGLVKEDPRIAWRLYEVALECEQIRSTGRRTSGPLS